MNGLECVVKKKHILYRFFKNILNSTLAAVRSELDRRKINDLAVFNCSEKIFSPKLLNFHKNPPEQQQSS